MLATITFYMHIRMDIRRKKICKNQQITLEHCTSHSCRSHSACQVVLCNISEKANNFFLVSVHVIVKKKNILQYHLAILKSDVVLKLLYYSQFDQVSNNDEREYFWRHRASQLIVIQPPAKKSQSLKSTLQRPVQHSCILDLDIGFFIYYIKAVWS